MTKAIWILGLSLVFAGADLSARPRQVDPPSEQAWLNMRMTEHCEELHKQFDAIDSAQIDTAKLAAAEQYAARGGSLCQTDPGQGIRVLDKAIKDVGVRPR